jgi:hypothetical protein
MGALDATRAAQILDAIHAVTALVASTAPLRLRQMTANGSATANGTEVATGGGYTSGTGAPSITMGAATVASPSVAASSTAVNITNWPRAETVVGVETWDSAGTPKRQEWGALTANKVMAAADTLSYSIGAITHALG